MLKEEQAKLQSQILNMEQEKMLSANKITELETKVKLADETVSKEKDIWGHVLIACE